MAECLRRLLVGRRTRRKEQRLKNFPPWLTADGKEQDRPEVIAAIKGCLFLLLLVGFRSLSSPFFKQFYANSL